MVSPRSSLTSSGSDTRLDDFKPNYAKFTPHNVGMAGIGQWLKSLRLHKYVWLFSNITYDQMLDISEEYLQKLNVTKGARHKLVVCIQKLKDRHSVLVQLEKDLLTNQIQMVVALEELTGIVLTPMKPVEHFNKNDVGGQFLKVLNLGMFSKFIHRLISKIIISNSNCLKSKKNIFRKYFITLKQNQVESVKSLKKSLQQASEIGTKVFLLIESH